MSELREFQPDLFTLEDEEGIEQTFELCDIYEEDDTTYFALIPHKEDNEVVNEEEDYFVILKRDDNDPDEYLNSIDDVDEQNRIAEIFLSRLLDDEHECHDENCGCCH